MSCTATYGIDMSWYVMICHDQICQYMSKMIKEWLVNLCPLMSMDVHGTVWYSPCLNSPAFLRRHDGHAPNVVHIVSKRCRPPSYATTNPTLTSSCPRPSCTRDGYPQPSDLLLDQDSLQNWFLYGLPGSARAVQGMHRYALRTSAHHTLECSNPVKSCTHD